MATIAVQPCRHADDHGKAPSMINVTCTSATPLEGDLMARTNNIGVVCSADPTKIAFLCPVVYTETMPGSASLILPLIKVRSSDVFEMNAYHSTASSATVADADLDDVLYLGIRTATVNSVTAWVVDLEETTNLRVKVLERLDAAADIYPRLRVQFMTTVCAYA